MYVDSFNPANPMSSYAVGSVTIPMCEYTKAQRVEPLAQLGNSGAGIQTQVVSSRSYFL